MRGVYESCGCFPTGRHYPGIAHLLRIQVVEVAAEFDDTQAWADLPVVMIDTETTGRDPSTDRIVELAIVTGKRGEVVSQQSWLINPGCPIPAEATAIHGITDDQVRDQPSFAEICDVILAALGGAIPAAYNAPFDRAFLLAEIRRACKEGSDAPAVRQRVEWVDPLVWARHLFVAERSRKLGDIATLLGIELEQAHRATADAEAALHVMYALARDRRVPVAYGALIREQMRLGRAQEEARLMWRNRG